MDRLLNNDQAADILNISPYSLRGKVSRREIPFIKVGRRTLFDPEDLRAYIDARKVPARPRREAE
jgi:excisionase family DNA binding protein